MYSCLRQQTTQIHVFNFKTQVIFRRHVTCRLSTSGGTQPSRSHREYLQIRFLRQNLGSAVFATPPRRSSCPFDVDIGRRISLRSPLCRVVRPLGALLLGTLVLPEPASLPVARFSSLPIGSTPEEFDVRFRADIA